ncbi:MAG TPA: hypothetical protein VIL36_06935 [Acidimicrobiales bacterium]
MGGFSRDGGRRRGGRPRRGPRQGRVGAALVLAVTLGLVGAGCEPECEPPYRAVAGQRLDPPAGSWPVTGSARPWAPVLDSDGDGAAETFELSDDLHQLVVHRTAGDLVLRAEAPEQLWTSDPFILALGDLDGDGRTDLGVIVESSDGSGPSRHVIVRGAVPNGTYDVDEVGVAILPMGGEDIPNPRPAGDVDADGHADVMVGTRATTTVWSGRDLDLVPPAAPAAPTYELDLPAATIPVRVTPTQTGLVLLEEATVEGDTVVTATLWLPTASLSFTTAGSGIAVTAPAFAASAAIVEDGDQLWLTLDLHYRTLRERWAWDLDDLCAAAP